MNIESSESLTGCKVVMVITDQPERGQKRGMLGSALLAPSVLLCHSTNTLLVCLYACIPFLYAHMHSA